MSLLTRHLVHHRLPLPLSRPASTSITTSHPGKKRLIILGSGWSGYMVAKGIDKRIWDVTVVSPKSYFSFTPLLASTCVGTLETRCAIEAVRGIKDVEFRQGWADTVDWKEKTVQVMPSLPSPPSSPTSSSSLSPTPYSIPYDNLLISVGSYSADFGIQGVKKYARFLKDIRDARDIRSRILECLETAAQPYMTDQQRRDILSFRIVGGGPTGVEFGAELHDLIESDVKRLYPSLYPLCEITLYDVAPGILQSFDESLRQYATKKFERDGVRVKANSSVTAVGDGWMEIKDQGRVPFGLLVWSTGLAPNPFVANLKGVAHDGKTKSILTDEHLRALDEENSVVPGVYAIGDNAMLKDGPSLPATAQVAAQKAKWLAKELNITGGNPDRTGRPSFVFANKGSMVFIGSERAMIDRSGEDVSGPKGKEAGILAWILWRSAYMSMEMSWRNRILIPIYWTLSWALGRDISRF